MKRILVFATGTQQPAQGGSGLRWLILDIFVGRLNGEICGIVTPSGSSVDRVASLYGLERWLWDATRPANEQYRNAITHFGPDLVVLSGWLRRVVGVNWGHPPIVNIHPAPLPDFGGKGMYGLHVHEAVLESGRKFTEVTIHFVNDKYDGGDIIFTSPPIPILEGDTPKILQERVKRYEHGCYGPVLNLVLQGRAQIGPKELPECPPR